MYTALKKYLHKEQFFLITIAILVLLSAVFFNTPQIAMWFGFLIAGYSAIANDSIQTLGTFISSNKKFKWYTLAFFIAGIMVLVLWYAYFFNGGDMAYGRLDRIEQPTAFTFLELLAPIILLVLTHYRVPVSTTFLLLSVFSTGSTIKGMLNKTFIGYITAFLAAYFIWLFIAKMRTPYKARAEPKKYWRVLQWLATSLLWVAWLQQDTANIYVFLPRAITFSQLVISSLFLVGTVFLLFYFRGGKIQQIVTEKADIIEVKSATMIDLFFALILIFFKELNNLPMSTTWVFLGLLAGRELAMIGYMGWTDPYKKTWKLIFKDLGKASIGIAISLALAVMIQNSWV